MGSALDATLIALRNCRCLRIYRAEILRHGLSSRTDMQLLVDMANVIVDGVVTDAQGAGDFFVEESLRQVSQHLLFTRGELGGLGFYRGRMAKGLDRKSTRLNSSH